MGGMPVLLQLIFSHDYEAVRKHVCKIFNQINSNKIKVQKFAVRAGAINLAVLVDLEKSPVMRDVIVGSLRSFVGGANFVGKRQYISTVSGLS